MSVLLFHINNRTTLTMINNEVKEGSMIVGHNLCKFDIPFLHGEASRYGIDINFLEDQVIDTGLLVKGMQLNLYPEAGEPIHSYWRRVISFWAKGVKFNLDKYCVSRFGLEKHGASTSCAHDAGYDCWLTHLVLCELNNIIDNS